MYQIKKPLMQGCEGEREGVPRGVYVYPYGAEGEAGEWFILCNKPAQQVGKLSEAGGLVMLIGHDQRWTVTKGRENHHRRDDSAGMKGGRIRARALTWEVPALSAKTPTVEDSVESSSSSSDDGRCLRCDRHVKTNPRKRSMDVKSLSRPVRRSSWSRTTSCVTLLRWISRFWSSETRWGELAFHCVCLLRLSWPYPCSPVPRRRMMLRSLRSFSSLALSHAAISPAVYLCLSDLDMTRCRTLPADISATTHSDLLLRAADLGVPTKVIHNASILTALGSTGLQMYNFGQTLSMVFYTETWAPSSWYDRLEENLRIGMHTLVLVDIKVREQSEENMAR